MARRCGKSFQGYFIPIHEFVSISIWISFWPSHFVSICDCLSLGEPIFLVQLEYFNPDDYKTVDEFIRTVLFFFEKSFLYLPPDLEKGLIFFDMAGFSLSRYEIEF
jgi:hypothetical protein